MLRVLRPASDISPGRVLGMVVTNLRRSCSAREGNLKKLSYDRRKVTLPSDLSYPTFRS